MARRDDEPGPGATPTGKLRAAVAGDWDAAVTHPFVARLFAGTLPVSAMRAYLVQDYQFVDSFVALMGAAVAVADTTRARMVIARQLGSVAVRRTPASGVPFTPLASKTTSASTRSCSRRPPSSPR